jgi:hypothetical protein
MSHAQPKLSFAVLAAIVAAGACTIYSENLLLEPNEEEKAGGYPGSGAVGPGAGGNVVTGGVPGLGGSRFGGSGGATSGGSGPRAGAPGGGLGGSAGEASGGQPGAAGTQAGGTGGDVSGGGTGGVAAGLGGAATGGVAGAAGAVASGGVTGAAGTVATGGAAGTAGAPGSGGVVATGGAPGTGGSGGQVAGSGGQTAGAGGSGGTVDEVVFFDDFENGAGNWTVTQSLWTPTADVTTVFTSSNQGNEARALAGDMTWTDMTVSGSVKIMQMDDGRRIYLAARYIDSNNWYGAALYNSEDRRAQIRKKSGGSSSDIASVPFEFELNTWYRIELSIAGSELSLRVDDVLMTSGTDTEFAAGGIALLADRSEVSWDDIVVTIP